MAKANKDQKLSTPKKGGKAKLAKDVGIAVVEQALVTGAAAVGGPIVAVGMKGFVALVKGVVTGRAAKREDVYMQTLAQALETDDPQKLAELAADHGFAETTFQTYRKAMDALSPAVVPSLARLGVFFSHRPLDALFRSLGRTLQDLEDEGAFEDLRRILTAVVKVTSVDGERVEVELFDTRKDVDPAQGPHMRLLVDDGRFFTDKTGAGHFGRGTFSYLVDASTFARVDAVLVLLERHGLAHGDWGRTRENAPAASFILDALECRRALEIVRPIAVELVTMASPPIEAQPLT